MSRADLPLGAATCSSTGTLALWVQRRSRCGEGRMGLTSTRPFHAKTWRTAYCATLRVSAGSGHAPRPCQSARLVRTLNAAPEANSAPTLVLGQKAQQARAAVMTKFIGHTNSVTSLSHKTASFPRLKQFLKASPSHAASRTRCRGGSRKRESLPPSSPSPSPSPTAPTTPSPPATPSTGFFDDFDVLLDPCFDVCVG